MFTLQGFCLKINENKWKKEWEGEIIFNHGTSNIVTTYTEEYQ